MFVGEEHQQRRGEKDLETGWSHFELREYDPVIGRWTAVDPKRIGFSPYIGMSNNPVSETDPDGGGPGDDTEMEYADAMQQMDMNLYDQISMSGATLLASNVIVTGTKLPAMNFQSINNKIPVPMDAVRNVMQQTIPHRPEFKYGGLYVSASTNDGNNHTGVDEFKQQGQGESLDLSLLYAYSRNDDGHGIMESKPKLGNKLKKDSIVDFYYIDSTKYMVDRGDGTFGTPFMRAIKGKVNLTTGDTLEKSTQRFP